jgi:hypothetical protein
VHKDNFPESANLYKKSWAETVSSEHLWQMAKEKPVFQQIKERKWKLEERFTSNRQVLKIGTLRDNVREEELREHGGEW